MKEWIVKKWDWWIYYRALHSLRRMCERNPGFAYLMRLHIQEYREKYPISPELEHATEGFHRAMSEHKV